MPSYLERTVCPHLSYCISCPLNTFKSLKAATSNSPLVFCCPQPVIMDNPAVSSDAIGRLSANQVIAPSEPAQEYRTQSSQSATGITDSGMARHSMSSLSKHSSTNDGNTIVATPARATRDLQTSDSKY